jgi:hypothetical protein
LSWHWVTPRLHQDGPDVGLLEELSVSYESNFFLNSGPLGRLFVLGGITGLMISPRLYLRDGGASADDLKNFPVDLKRKLIVLHWSTGFFLLVLFGLFAVDEFVLG